MLAKTAGNTTQQVLGPPSPGASPPPPPPPLPLPPLPSPSSSGSPGGVGGLPPLTAAEGLGERSMSARCFSESKISSVPAVSSNSICGCWRAHCCFGVVVFVVFDLTAAEGRGIATEANLEKRRGDAPRERHESRMICFARPWPRARLARQRQRQQHQQHQQRRGQRR